MSSINEKCLQKLDPYITAVRTVMEIPLIAHIDSWEGEGKILDVIEKARKVINIELKDTPKMEEDKRVLLSALDDIIVKDKRGGLALTTDFQRYVDDAKCFAEQILLDEYAQCACRR